MFEKTRFIHAIACSVTFVMAAEMARADVFPITTTVHARSFAIVNPNPQHPPISDDDLGSTGDFAVSAHDLSSSNGGNLSCETTTDTTAHVAAGGTTGNTTLHANWTAINLLPPGNPPPGGTFSSEMKFYYSFMTDAPATISITMTTTLNTSGDTDPGENAMSINHTLTFDGQFTDLPPNGVTTVEYALSPGFHQLTMEHYPNIGMSPWPNVNATTDTQLSFAITLPGDMNCDGAVNGLDIQAFEVALLTPANYLNVYPTCNLLNGDMNDDAAVTTADSPLFAQALLN